MKVDILGTPYTIKYTAKKDDKTLSDGNCGYHSYLTDTIVIGNLNTYREYDDEAQEAKDELTKVTIRHELIHAHLAESGLDASSMPVDMWAKNEEMVDWFAMQWPKINKSIEEVTKFIFKQ